jgi:hypothetical protein
VTALLVLVPQLIIATMRSANAQTMIFGRMSGFHPGWPRRAPAAHVSGIPRGTIDEPFTPWLAIDGVLVPVSRGS